MLIILVIILIEILATISYMGYSKALIGTIVFIVICFTATLLQVEYLFSSENDFSTKISLDFNRMVCVDTIEIIETQQTFTVRTDFDLIQMSITKTYRREKQR